MSKTNGGFYYGVLLNNSTVYVTLTFPKKGHVNHGKTTLLDNLRNTDVVSSEPGFITQSLSAFTVDYPEPESFEGIPPLVTMLDTPGHAAFFLMRENGASVSDFLVLLIAADEGMGPQTLEVVRISQDSNIPIIVCINKIDIASPKNISRVYKQLHKHGLLDPKITHDNNPYMMGRSHVEYEGEKDYTVKAVIELSALNGTNIDILLRALKEKTELIAEFLHPNNTDEKAECTVIESSSHQGLGKILNVIVHWGYLSPGQWFVTDRYIGRIKTIYSSKGVRLDKALPGYPVVVTGIKTEDEGFPPTGSGLFALPKNMAEVLQEHRLKVLRYKSKEIQGLLFKPERTYPTEEIDEDENFDDDDDTIAEEAVEPEPAQSPNQPWKKAIHTASETALPVVLRADNVGRLETLLGLCETLCKEGQIDITVISHGVGDVVITDLLHAQIELENRPLATVPIYCFGDITIQPSAKQWLAKNQHFNDRICIEQHKVIYDIIARMKVHIVENRMKE